MIVNSTHSSTYTSIYTVYTCLESALKSCWNTDTFIIVTQWIQTLMKQRLVVISRLLFLSCICQWKQSCDKCGKDVMQNNSSPSNIHQQLLKTNKVESQKQNAFDILIIIYYVKQNREDYNITPHLFCSTWQLQQTPWKRLSIRFKCRFREFWINALIVQKCVFWIKPSAIWPTRR